MGKRTSVLLGLVLFLALGAVAVWWYHATSTPEYRLRQGQRALHQGNTGSAENHALQLEAAGHRDHALLLRGEAAMQAGQFAQALACFNQIRDQGALRLEAVAFVGRCLLELGNLLEAERAFAYLLSQRPEDIDAHRGLAAVYYDQGAWPAAEHHCRQWANLAPQDGRPHRLMGLMYKDLSKFPEAVATYEAALQRDLKDHVKEEVREELAECLVKMGNYQTAWERLEQSPAGLLASVKVLTLKAECLRNLGRGKEAQPLVQEAVAADPRNVLALRLQGRLLLESDRVAEAVAVLEKAIALPQQDFETHHVLAQAYARLGRTKESVEQQAKVKEIQGWMEEMTKLTRTIMDQPKDAHLHRRMAELYDQLNMPAMAERSRRTAQRVAPPAPGK